MGQYRLTFAQLKSEAEHAISGTPDARTSSARCVNDAIEWLVTYHRWSWRRRLATLSIVADQSYVNLPADFGELLQIHAAASSTGLTFQPASLEQVALSRVYTPITAGVTFFYAISTPVQTLATDTMAQRLELGPTPDAAYAAGIAIVYLALPREMTGDTDVPEVPYGFFSLLRRAVRAFAVSDSVQQAGHDWELLNRQLGDYVAADTFAANPGGQAGQLVSQLDDYAPGAEACLPPHTSILMVGD